MKEIFLSLTEKYCFTKPNQPKFIIQDVKVNLKKTHTLTAK